ncbi:hypothetical protein PI124_g7560 [Phytophthora idaei]|nr:hypothetical protein PI124_g7560 [Phytophthora idaei]
MKSKRCKVKRHPSHPEPGFDSVRSATAKVGISKEAVHKLLPGGIIWKDVRPDVRGVILAGVGYNGTLEWIESGRPARDLFRQPALTKVLVSMIYWGYTQFHAVGQVCPKVVLSHLFADMCLDHMLRRGEEPAYWGWPRDHTIEYLEGSSDSEDDEEGDPNYQGSEGIQDEDDEDSDGSTADNRKPGHSGVKSPTATSNCARNRSNAGSPSSSSRKKVKHHHSDTSSSAPHDVAILMIVQLTREELVVTKGHHTRLPSPLAAISYVDLTSDDVVIVEIPCCDVTTRGCSRNFRVHLRILRIKLQASMTTRSARTVSTSSKSSGPCPCKLTSK